jgi:hypothetical protein
VGEYIEWLRYGIDAGFCTQPTCAHHDGTPMTDEEIAAFEDGDDSCIYIVRLWATA